MRLGPKSVLLRANLLKESLEIEIVPGFKNLAVFDSAKSHPGDMNRFVGCFDTDTISSVRSANSAVRGNQIVFGKDVVDSHIDIGKRVVETMKERFEAFGTVQFYVGRVTQSVSDTLRMKHLINCRDATFVPHFLKPPTN